MKFYEVTDQVGGEDIWLRRIAKTYNEVPNLIWPKGKQPLIKPISLWDKILLKFSIILERVFPEIGRGLFLNFLFAFYKMPDEVTFLSTTYIPIPRGKRIIGYIHTPSRAMTVDYQFTLESHSSGNLMSKILLKLLRFSYRTVYKFSLPHAKILLTNSVNVQKRILDFVGIKSEVCYPTQDTASFYSNEPENYFLLVSKIQPYKGHDFCLRAFKIFYEKNKNFKLVIVSVTPKTKEEISYFYQLMSFVNEHGLPVEFKFDLERNAVIELYSKAYLCLFGSKNEDLGQVPIEAMASGKPIVSMKGSGPSETIVDHITGFLVEDELQMAEKLSQLVNDQSMAKQMGTNGRERVLNLFDDSRFRECLNKKLELF